MNWRRWFSTSDDVSILPTRHKFESNEALLNRQIEAAKKLRDKSVVRDWPRDANGSPIDFEDLPV